MSSELSRVLPPTEVHLRDSEGEFSATVQRVLPVDSESTGSVVFIPGHFAGSDSFAYHADGIIKEVLRTPYGVDVCGLNPRYSSRKVRSIGHRAKQAAATLEYTRNSGVGKTVVISHSEGNHVALGALMYRPELLRDIGGVIGLGMVSVNSFSGAEQQGTCVADMGTPLVERKPIVNVPLLGFTRALVEEAIDHLPTGLRESHSAELMRKLSGAAGRLGLKNVIPEHAQASKVSLLPLAGAGVGEVVDMLPYAAVSPDARKALVTLLSNVMKLSIGSNPFGEGHQILTTPTADMSAILSELVPVAHFTGTKDRLSVGSIKDGLLAAGFKGDVHEYDMGHLDLLYRRPVIRRTANIAMRYMFNIESETDADSAAQFEMTPADHGVEFIVREGVRSLRRRLGIAA